MDDFAKLQAESEIILKENEQLRKQAADTEKEKAEIVDELEKQNAKMKSFHHDHRMELRGKDAELCGKKAQIDELKAKIQKLEAQVS